MQDGFLIAPFVPAIMGGGPHGEIAALVVIERCKPVLALCEPPFLMLVRLMAGNGDEAFRHNEAMIAQADRKLRQGMDAAAVPAGAPEQAGDGRKLQRAAGAERVLVGTALRCRDHAVVGRAGDDFAQAHDAFLGTVGDIGVGRQGGERGQALEVDREIGCGVELRHFPGLEMIEPGTHAGGADGALLGARAAGAGEGFVRLADVRRDRRRCGTAARGFPRNTTARRCRAHPSSSGNRGSPGRCGRGSLRRYPCPRRCATRSAARARKSAQSWQSSIDGRISSIIASVSAPARPLASRAKARTVSRSENSRDFVERLGDAVGKRRRCRALAAGMADLDAERPRCDEVAGLQRDAEMAEIGRCVFRRADDQTRVARLEDEVIVEAFGRHEVALDGDIDSRHPPAEARQDAA